MIIVDYSSISIGAIFAQGKNKLDENLIRHMILNSLRMYNVKYRNEYGRMILACDSKSWRTSVYPEYKASRRAAREKSSENLDIDWSEIFGMIDSVTKELDEFSPYTVLKIDNAEADDIIAELVHTTQEFGQHEPVMIISGDKDFIQLHQYDNVKQFSPILKKQVTNSNPKKYLFEHVCRGDSSDGVPNILSDDRVFVDGGRQTPLRKKRLEEWYDAHCKDSEILNTLMDSRTYRNYMRNNMMIDLKQIPDDVKSKIKEAWESSPQKQNNKILNYLISKRCTNLVACVDEFFTKN